MLGEEFPRLDSVQRAKEPQRLPVVLSPEEVRRLLAELEGKYWVAGNLLYGAGLRLLECLRLRVQDIDFAMHQVVVRGGKGAKDRVTVLPDAVTEALTGHLEQVRTIHRQDLAKGLGRVYLPPALARKYPAGALEWTWYFVFPPAPSRPCSATRT